MTVVFLTPKGVFEGRRVGLTSAGAERRGRGGDLVWERNSPKELTNQTASISVTSDVSA